MGRRRKSPSSYNAHTLRWAEALVGYPDRVLFYSARVLQNSTQPPTRVCDPISEQYLQGCPRPELKKLATEAGLNFKGNAKKPTLVKSLLAHYAKRVAQVGYT
jgi:hypothetical protein